MRPRRFHSTFSQSVVSSLRAVHPHRALLPSAVLLAACASLKAEDSPSGSVAETLGKEVRGIFQKSARGVVRIEASDDHGQLSGTGFFVDPTGTLYTSYSIGGETSDLVVCSGNLKIPAQRIFADSRSGIAVLKVDAVTPFIPIGESHSIAVGAPVVAIGFPMDLPMSPNFGTIAGFDIKYRDRYFATRHIRANVPVQRGEGGAPLLNMQGEAVGILIASLDQGSACYCLPIEAAEKARRVFNRFGELRPGWLGVGIETAEFAQGGSTAEINMINIGAPGQQAGLHSGDVIVEINGRTIASPEDVLDAAFYIAEEDDVKVKVSRAGVKLDFNLTAVGQPNTNVRTAGDIPTFVPGSADLRGIPTLEP